MLLGGKDENVSPRAPAQIAEAGDTADSVSSLDLQVLKTDGDDTDHGASGTESGSPGCAKKAGNTVCCCGVCGRLITDQPLPLKLHAFRRVQDDSGSLCAACMYVCCQSSLEKASQEPRCASAPVLRKDTRTPLPCNSQAWEAPKEDIGKHPHFSRSWQVGLARESRKVGPLPAANVDGEVTALPIRCLTPRLPKGAQSAPVPALVDAQSLHPDPLVTMSQDSFFKRRAVSYSKPNSPKKIFSSSSTLVCRICQLGELESGEPVKMTDCDCRGGLELIHRSCLVEWVRYKGNNTCELCNANFADVVPPERTESDIYRMQIRRQILRHYASQRPISNAKRGLLAVLIVFLAVTTTALVLLTFKAEREFTLSSAKNNTSMGEQRKSYIRFAFCWSFLLFSSSIFLIVLIFWISLEASVVYHRWRVRGLAQQLVDSLFAPPHPRPRPPPDEVVASVPAVPPATTSQGMQT